MPARTRPPRAPHRHRRVAAARVATALATVAALGACASSPAPMSTLALNRAKVDFVQVGVPQVRAGTAALVDVATTVGAAVAAGQRPGETGATAVSPWSLLQLVMALRLGAEGDTAAALDRLGLTRAKHPARAMAALTGQVQQWSGDPGQLDPATVPVFPLLQTGAAILIDRDLSVHRDYLNELGKYLNNGVYPVRFDGLDAALGEWAAVNTGGTLTSVPLPGDASDTGDALVYAGTAYLAAGWALPFDARRTHTGVFTGPRGPSPVQFMRSTLPARVAAGDGFTALQLDYGTTLALQILLPPPGGDPAALLARRPLTEARLALAGAPVAAHDVTLPRWSASTWIDPLPRLRALGLSEVLDGAGLAGIADAHPTLSAARLGAVLTVGERGTVMGAAETTGADGARTERPGDGGAGPVEAADAAPGPSPFTADRPFTYSLVDTATGLPLLVGTVTRPVG